MGNGNHYIFYLNSLQIMRHIDGNQLKREDDLDRRLVTKKVIARGLKLGYAAASRLGASSLSFLYPAKFELT